VANRELRTTSLGSAMPSRVSTSLSAVASREFTDPVHSPGFIQPERSGYSQVPLCKAFEHRLDSRQRLPCQDGQRIFYIVCRSHPIQHSSHPLGAPKHP
jgi:hypothetical protein